MKYGINNAVRKSHKLFLLKYTRSMFDRRRNKDVQDMQTMKKTEMQRIQFYYFIEYMLIRNLKCFKLGKREEIYRVKNKTTQEKKK